MGLSFDIYLLPYRLSIEVVNDPEPRFRATVPGLASFHSIDQSLIGVALPSFLQSEMEFRLCSAPELQEQHAY